MLVKFQAMNLSEAASLSSPWYLSGCHSHASFLYCALMVASSASLDKPNTANALSAPETSDIHNNVSLASS